MSKKKKLDALRKTYEEEKLKRKQESEFKQKLFPKGVLERDPTGTPGILLNKLQFKQLEVDLSNSISKDFAERLQAIEDSNLNKQKLSAKARVSNGLQNFKTILNSYGIVVKSNTTAGQIEKLLIEKGEVTPPDTKTIRKYLLKIKGS